MTRNRFNQAKHQSGKPLLGSSGNNLTISMARGLFLEDNDNIDMKDTYKSTNVHPPIDEKDVVSKEYCDNNLLSSNKKRDILSRNITELRKGHNQLKLEIDNNKFNQNITNIQLNEMFTTGLKVFKEVNKKTNSFIDEALLKNKKRIVQYIIAILLKSTLVDNKEKSRLEMHYDFYQEDIMKKIEKNFTN